MSSYSNPFKADKKPQKRIFTSDVTQPDVIKSDCKVGKFVEIGGDKKSSPDQIEMQVVKFANIPNAVLFPHGEGENVKREHFDWTEVFFINVRGILCSTLLKNESRDNFLRAVRDCEVNSEGAKNFSNFVFVAAMASRVNKRKEDYHAVEFGVSEISPEDLKRNKAFAAEFHEGIFSARTMREFITQNLPQIAKENQAKVAADLLFGFGFVGKETHEALLKNAGVQLAVDETATTA